MTATPAHILRGEQTRKRVLQIAVRVATVEGLESLTIGKVAQAAAITKAGLLGHYVTKEALQLATLKAGGQMFIEQVVEPAKDKAPGLLQLLKLLDGWVDAVTREKGGCFFASVAAEFDCRTGPVRDAIAQMIEQWFAGLAAVIVTARKLRQLRNDVDVDALILKLYGMELALNLRLQLLKDTKARALTRRAMRDTLREIATPTGRRLIEEYKS